MSEHLDILDSFGNATGKNTTKENAHLLGLFHATIHVWIVNDSGEFLIQKRHTSKINYPNVWDVSVAGHISSGETPEEACKREVFEEIGLAINPSKLRFVGITKTEIVHTESYVDNEFHHVYIYNTSKSINEFTLQDSEVLSIKYVTKDKLIELSQNSVKFVPYSNQYYKRLFNTVS